MGIKGSVLHDNVLGNTDTERGEVPYGLDTALYHGDAAQCRTHQFGLHIESSYYLQTEMAQTRVAQQGTSQASDTEQKGFVYIGKSQEILQHSYQCVHLIAYTRTSRDIDIRKVFGNL